MSKHRIACAAAGVILLARAPGFARERHPVPMTSPKAVELKLALRDLWVGHIFWVRNVVLDTRFGQMDAAKAAEGMAVENARGIANSIIPYYGKDAADKLFTLLAGHYTGVKEYMTAAFAGKTEAENAASEKLRTNVEDISAFLSSANSYLPKATLVTLLTAHVGHHIMQITDVERKDYTAEAKSWEEMTKNIYVISDALADGIVRQFPKKFESGLRVSMK